MNCDSCLGSVWVLGVVEAALKWDAVCVCEGEHGTAEQQE